ncbi:dipeptidase PepE [Pedobacter hiemivivus]|uniref:Dipeptidase PepE n=1 Tax=Pedobacter hiemivivus TaxID=2530454 RepID=A0A4U1G8X4_9SPHI|nr:dipeptidase PepE [Pedobacter hiemivivus]TKC59210.1 dipeptidase PepE [Pedobacter hiemivivus]
MSSDSKYNSVTENMNKLNSSCNCFTNKKVLPKGLHRFEDPAHALKSQQLMNVLKEVVENGVPYLGTSAGSNIGGLNMQNTNDMPIVYPPSFNTLELIPFNINAHYLDPAPNSKHNGETRETRIKEFHVFNKVPVLGLREGSWIRVKGDRVTTEGMFSSRVFLPELPPYEIQPGSVCAFETRQNPL